VIQPARRSALTLAAVVASALCIPVALLLVVDLMRLHDDAVRRSARHAAIAAGRTAAEHLLAYDYRHIAADVARARSDTAGSFRGQYESASKPLEVEARRLKAIVSADVKSVAVASAGRDHAILLLFVDQASVKKVPGHAAPVSRLDENRVRMTLRRSHGRWLVTDLASL
jgi:Mce-associated membrane protein